jgi:CRP/FNR family transcriptional regulator, nitrogen oxide reductase regulator
VADIQSKPASRTHPIHSKSIIYSLEVFKALPPHLVPEVEKKLVERKYAKGSTLFLEGDPAEFVWFIKDGHVKAVVHTPNGRDLTLCMMQPKNMVGRCCCFGEKEHRCHGVAESDVTVLTYPTKDFYELLDKYPAMARAVMESISHRLRLSKDMQTFEQESVEKRILHVLVNLVEKFGNTIPLTRREIAEMAGTTVETCIRTFAGLEREKLVSSTRGKIMVRDVKDLENRMRSL